LPNKAISYHWHYPTEVYLQPGGLNQLKFLLGQISAQAPLLVIDEFLLNDNKLLTCLDTLKPYRYRIFSAFAGNPTSDHIEQGCNEFNQGHCDAVVTIGGGSAIDVGKTIALVAKQHKPVWDFIDEGDNYLRADATIIAPIIAIPTTAGTGSEVGRAALITHPETKAKKIIFHPKMMPSIALLDPELTVSLPASLTAATGMDALAHNLEAYCVDAFHPQADGIALEGLRLIKDNLVTAFTDGHNLSARSNMMVASLMGATAFQKGLGAVHSLSHPIGGTYNAHHGLLNAIFLPYVLNYNKSHIEAKMQTLAQYLNLGSHNFDAVLNWIIELNVTLQLPNNLSGIVTDLSQADLIAANAFADPSTTGNPRKMTTEDCKTLFTAAFNGDLNQAAMI
jgi:alcohol dehydrogenase class IV